MIREKSKCFLFVLLCGFLSIFLIQAPASAGEWKTVDQDESVITLKNWPGTDNCSFRTKMASNYSKKITAGYCPKSQSDEMRTYIRVLEMMPGMRWGWTYGTDFSEHPIFTKVWKKLRWFEFFKDPNIKPGQKTKCYNDDECRFRRIEFSVKGQECQWVLNIPDLGHPNSDAPFGIEIFTCQTSIPFTKKHILMEPGKVTLVFPGPFGAPKSDTFTGADQRLRELKKLLEGGLITKEEAAAKRQEILKKL